MLYDNSHIVRVIALLTVTPPPDCHSGLQSLIVRCEQCWPRAPPFPGPGHDNETRNTRTPEPGSVRTRSSREYSCQKMSRGQQTLWGYQRGSGANERPESDTSSQWEEGMSGVKNASGAPCSCIFNSLNHNSLDIWVWGSNSGNISNYIIVSPVSYSRWSFVHFWPFLAFTVNKGRWGETDVSILIILIMQRMWVTGASSQV